MSRRAAYVDAEMQNASQVCVSYNELLTYPHTQPLKEVFRVPMFTRHVVPIEGKTARDEPDDNTARKMSKIDEPPLFEGNLTALQLLKRIEKEGVKSHEASKVHREVVEVAEQKIFAGTIPAYTAIHVFMSVDIITKKNVRYRIADAFLVEAELNGMPTLDKARLYIVPEKNDFESRKYALDVRGTFNRLLEPGDFIFANERDYKDSESYDTRPTLLYDTINKLQDQAREQAVKKTLEWLADNRPTMVIYKENEPSILSTYYFENEPLPDGATLYDHAIIVRNPRLKKR